MTDPREIAHKFSHWCRAENWNDEIHNGDCNTLTDAITAILEAERERCAKVAEGFSRGLQHIEDLPTPSMIAAAIREGKPECS